AGLQRKTAVAAGQRLEYRLSQARYRLLQAASDRRTVELPVGACQRCHELFGMQRRSERQQGEQRKSQQLVCPFYRMLAASVCGPVTWPEMASCCSMRALFASPIPL